MRNHLRLPAAALLLLLAGCAGADRLAGIPPDRLYAMAEAAGADEDYEEAQKILDRIRDDHPFSRFAVEAELLTADLKFQEEKFEEAAALYRSFEQLHPTQSRVAYAIYRRGLAYWRLSSVAGRDQADTHNAAEAFQKLLYGYADSEYAAPAREQLARVRSRLAAHEIHVGRYYLRRERYAAALGRLEGVVREFPDTPELAEAQQLAVAARAGMPPVNRNPSNNRPREGAMDTAMIELYHQGREAFEGNRYEDARRCFSRLAESGCRFADVFNMLGAIAFAQGDYDGARKEFRTALEINPRYTEAHLNLAVTLNETGDYDSAALAYGGAERASIPAQGGIDPYVKGRLANLHADIGEIYHGLGLHEESVAEYRKALALGPLFPDLRVRLGILFRDMGEYQKAVDEFEKVKQDNLEFPTAGVQLGITYYSRGDIKGAVEEWKGVLSNHPDNPKALMYLRLAEKEQI